MRLELGGNNFGIISGILMVCYLAKPKKVMVAKKCSTVSIRDCKGFGQLNMCSGPREVAAFWLIFSDDLVTAKVWCHFSHLTGNS